MAFRPQPTGAALVAKGMTHRGVPYSAAGGLRFGPNFYDCSGMIHNDLKEMGVDDSGASGWTSLAYQDWITRVDKQSRFAGAPGFVGDLGAARTTPGMIVCHGHQSGPGGHIALTIGNNQVLETPSAEGHKVGVSSLDRNHFDFAGYIPGIAYPDHERFTVGAATGLAKEQLPAGCSACLPTAVLLGVLGAAGVLELGHRLL